MKHHIYFLLITLISYSLPALPQCRDCKDIRKPPQPTSLTFNSVGAIISSMPTVIACDSPLDIMVVDKTLGYASQIQERLKQVINNKSPQCLKSDFDAAVVQANCQRTASALELDNLKTKTYSIDNTIQQNLNHTQHNLGTVSFSQPGKNVFRLTKKNADNIFFKDQFDKKPGYQGWSDYKPIVDQLYPTYSKYAANISQLDLTIKSLESNGQCCGQLEAIQLKKYKELRCSYLESIQATQIQLCKIANQVVALNKEWMSYWLWYTDGKPTLNPFGVVSPAEANEKIDTELASAEAVLRLYNALSDKCCESSRVNDMLTTLKPAIAELTRDLVQLRRLKENAPARQKKYDEWLKATAQTETVLNEVVLYATDCPQINWMSHYGYAANTAYAAMQPDGLLPALVYEHDALRGLVHNIPSGRQVSAKEVVKEAKLRTELDVQTDDVADTFTQALISSNAITSFLDRIRGSLNTIRAAVTEETSPIELMLLNHGSETTKSSSEVARQKTIIDELKNILFPLTIKPEEQQIITLNSMLHEDNFNNRFKEFEARLNKALEFTDSTRPVTKREFYEALKAWQDELKQSIESAKIKMNALGTVTCDARLDDFTKSGQLINWLMAQTEPPVADLEAAYNDFKKKKNTLDPALRSEDVLINESRNAQGTNDISYTISEAGKDKPVASGSYKTYNTVRFWPSVSINYVVGSRAVSIYDNATSQFRTDTDIDNFEAVVGVKWYLGPSNVTRASRRTAFIRNTLDSKYNLLRGNSLLGKVFVTGGLGVSHKFLRNYFLGLGIDIVPGFSIQGGGNLFFRKAYDLTNGQISREYDIPAGRAFFGIAIDPNVVTKLLSIF